MTSPASPTIELTDAVSRTTSRAVDGDVERGLPDSAASDDATAAPSRVVSEKDAADPFEVHWDGPDDPDCPLNMSTARKW